MHRTLAARRMLATGQVGFEYDEHLHLEESTTNQPLCRLCIAVIDIFEDDYLQTPTEADMATIVHIMKPVDFQAC